MNASAVRYRRSPDALSRAVGDEILACLPHWNEVDRMTASGAAIWRTLGEARTMTELTAEVAAAYAVPPAVVRKDVRRFVERLVERGLVHRLPAVVRKSVPARNAKETL